MSKIGHSYVVQYFNLKGLSPTNIKAELDSTLGKSAPSFTTINGISKSAIHRILTENLDIQKLCASLLTIEQKQCF